MKINKGSIVLSLTFVVLFFFNAYSQVEVMGTQSMLEKLRLEESIKGIQNMSYSDIEGNPFLFKDFERGYVVMKGGERYDVLLRYDKYAEEVQFKAGDMVYAVSNQDEIERVNIGGVEFIHSLYKMSIGSGNIKESYFEVLADGKYVLLAKKNIRVKDPEPPKLYTEAKPAEFIIQEDSYFIKSGTADALRIKTKNDLKAYFDGREEGVLQFVKRQKLNVNKKEDLVQVIKYVNQKDL